MNYKDTYYPNIDLEKFKKGIEKATLPIIKSMGRNGKHTAFRFSNNKLLVTNDGATIARHILNLKDDSINFVAAKLISNVCSETEKYEGDGTSLTALMFKTMVDLYVDEKASKEDLEIDDFIGRLEDTIKLILTELEKQSIPCTNEHLAGVAITSYKDEEIGGLIGQAIEQVGPHGEVIINAVGIDKTNEAYDFYSEKKNYLTVNKHMPFFGAFLLKQNKFYDPRTKQFHCENFYTILLDDSLALPSQQYNKFIDNLCKLANNQENNVILFVREISSQYLTKIEHHNRANEFQVLPIGIKGFDDVYTNGYYDDLAAFTCSDKITGINPNNTIHYNAKNIGKAFKIMMDANGGGLLPYEDNEEVMKAINARVEEIKTLKDSDKAIKNAIEQQFYDKRYGELKGGVAIITILCRDEIVWEDIKLRTDDARQGCRSALKNGIVAGGGVALKDVYKVLQSQTIPHNHILERLCDVHWETLLDNSRIKDFLPNYDKNYGIDLKTKKSVNMFEAGIIDSLGVIKSAFLQSLELFTTFTNIETIIDYTEEINTSTN